MDNNTVNPASVDQAARALIFQLASAVAANFDTARSLGYPDLMRTLTEFVVRPSRACEKGAAGPNR